MSCQQFAHIESRRAFLSRTGLGLGAAALSQLLGGEASAAAGAPGVTKAPHFPARAKRVIYLFQSGGPSHLDLFDDKPELRKRFDQDLPDSVRQGQRITGMVAGQARLALQPSKYAYKRCGQSGMNLSEMLPYTQTIADELCLIRSMNTEAINHDPAITFLQTGSQQPGRPSFGAWLDYGLGSMNQNLPSFVVLVSVSKTGAGQGLLSRLWGSGFLPGKHQGVSFRTRGEPVLFLNNPPGINQERRRDLLDGLQELNRAQFEASGDPEIETRISQYEMAGRMQLSVPELMDLKGESATVRELYGPEVDQPGSYARNCLLARRLAERDVRFIQLYHRDWDMHGDVGGRMPKICAEVDRPTAGLITDLKQRGLLEDTLVIFGGEFGRTPYAQGGAGKENYGRDHHGRAFSLWVAGGGFKPGSVYGQTDEFGFNIIENPVHVHDLQTTLLHSLGMDHTKLTFRFQGRDYRLTDIHGNLVRGLLA